MAQTMYAKYGGFSQINRIVMDLYDRILDSEEVGPYFDDVDMKRLIDHQTKFIAFLLGGPADFKPDHLQHAHRPLDISNAHFDDMKQILNDTLADAGFEPDDLKYVMDVIEDHRVQVVAPANVD